MWILNNLLYYFIIIPVSRLPYPMLYGLSDGLFVVFYYVGYRKKIVFQNIQRSFPDKTREEHVEICKNFYRHLCDLLLESLKVFTISEKEVKERMIFKNPELVDRYFNQGQSMILAGGHYNNWELFAVGIDAAIKHPAIAIYKPLSNLFFDTKMRATRSKYGLRMISTKSVKEVMDKEKNNLSMTIFGIDQSPGNPAKCYWTKFLNQDTGVLFGAEKYAKEYNYPVVFGHITKERRGFYSFEFIEVSDRPQTTRFGEITEKLTQLLEKDILQKPEHWLWSHKRWKHKRPVKVNEMSLTV